MKKLMLLTLLLNLTLAPLRAMSQEKEYVKITKQELRMLERNQQSLLQRVRNLETLYREIEKAFGSFDSAMKTIKSILGIADDEEIDNRANEENSIAEYEHISGVIMDPGSIPFRIRTRDGVTFDELGIKELEIDIYYNKNLFYIDKITGTKVFGNDFRIIGLPRSSRSAKDRIKLPLSDVLADEVRFKLFLGPRNAETIKVGDETRVEIRYFKRIPHNEDGSPGEAPLIYSKVEGFGDTIRVTVK